MKSRLLTVRAEKSLLRATVVRDDATGEYERKYDITVKDSDL